jgi:hypothetical protein
MELGVAGSISVQYISGGDIGKEINKWLETNPDTEVIDINLLQVQMKRIGRPTH